MSLKRLFLAQCFCLLAIISQSHAYSVPVHEQMSENAYNLSVLSSINGSYLVQIGLNNDEKFNGKKAMDRVKAGSNFEDNGLRALNHFYDPTTGQGILNLPNFIATDAINWGLKLRTVGTITQEWSIPDARNYFYNALTDPQSSVRETNWANTFQALGHVLHLIEDMAQPQHVRNDPHYENGNPASNIISYDHSRYEEFTADKNNINRLSYTGYPIVNFGNYISYWTAGGSGLADVTNRNFFSEREFMVCNGDICAEQGYAEPIISASSAVDQIVDVPTQTDGTKTGVMTFFPYTFVDPLTGEVVTNPRVLSHSFFDLDLLNIGGWPLFSQNKYTFDESQKILVKRAVGYAAGLLDYFFRGQLTVESVGTNQVVVQNLSEDSLNDGTIELYCDDTSGNRIQVGTVSVSSSINKGEFSNPISITPPSDIQKGYWAVFRGTLGAEQNAVIGSFTDLVWVEEWDKGFKDNHPWWVKVTDPIYQNYIVPGGSLQPTTVQNGVLTMSNFRPAGTVRTGPDSGLQYNEVIIGAFQNGDPKFAPYNDSFPKTISPNTFIRIKVDAMSTVPNPYQPSGFCDPALSSIGDPAWWEYIDLNFSMDGREYYNIKFTTPGNEGYDWSSFGYYNIYLTLGSEMRINVDQLFQSLGIPVVEPLQLNFIDINQQLWDYCSPLSVDQQQSLQMDYIRILEEATPP
ncbi:MAG: hypothetical protein HY203_05800 [Nitrospirae bacterium]|nr:hypothetical protein [Nitrospirota bacterium]